MHPENKKKHVLVCHVVSEADYLDAAESYLGWCQDCKEFTTSHVEPDAVGYKCDMCDQPQVVGAEQALLMGIITFR